MSGTATATMEKSKTSESKASAQSKQQCGDMGSWWQLGIAGGACLVLTLFAVNEHLGRRDEARLRAAYERSIKNSDIAQIITDSDGTIEAWSTGAEQLFGLTSNDAVGTNIERIIPADMQRQHRIGMRRSVQRGGRGEAASIVKCDAHGPGGVGKLPVLMNIERIEQRTTPKFLVRAYDRRTVNEMDWTESGASKERDGE